ncbi:MAG: hypothetical protein NTZ59_10585 [Bacteroidetes bacterium]|jgi:hypothetical protein|nr:hypothetical protein [Bacteroidota bacterium]
MRLPIFIILFIAISSCKQANKHNEKNTDDNIKVWKIKLENNLGFFEISLDKKLDTFFTWTEYSDCGDGCAHSDYRIQQKFNPIFKDDGFIYFPFKDSVLQFTIKHQKLIRISNNTDTTKENIKRITDFNKFKSFIRPNEKYILDTLINIGENPFSILGFRGYDSIEKTNFQTVQAVTNLRGNLIEIYFENRQKDKNKLEQNFINNSFEELKSIRLTYAQ